MIILAILAFGMLMGWLANLILGGGSHPQNWGPLLFAGLTGSFVGGLVISFVSGDGFNLRPSGIIGSLLGSVIVLAIYGALTRNRA